MSTIVKQIAEAIESRILAKTSYRELDYKLDITKNTFKGNKKRYGVIPKAGSTVEGVNKVYTMDHGFEMILTTSYVNASNNDADQIAKTFDLYDKADIIFKDVFLSKAGLPTIILNIVGIGLAEPEYIGEHHLIVLRSEFTVKYRNSLT